MYLKSLWLQNKVLCWFVILFAAFQVFNNVRQDAAFSPVYTYGMYSEVITPQKNYFIPEIRIDGKLLRAKDFTPQQWDKIMQPVLLFPQQEAWNRFQFQNYIARLLPASDSTFYLNDLSQAQFVAWYKKYLSRIVHSDISNLAIDYYEYDLSSSKPMSLRVLHTITHP
jgi:hypothetical protein